MHIFYVYVYKSFSTRLDKVLRKNIKRKKRERDGEIGKQAKWNGNTGYEVEKVKQTW